MTPPVPEPQPDPRPTDSPDERVDLLAGEPAAPKREVPVRPRELDLVRADPTPPASERLPPPQAPTPAPAPAGASAPTREQTADQPVPCPICTYDLRGRPGGARCPECGTVIQGKVRIAQRTGERRGARDALFDAWQRLAGSSLASVLLVSPLVYLMPLGVAIASCTGFGAAFRVVSLRAFDQLPGPLREPIARSIALWRRLEQAQIAIAITITVGGLLSSVGVVGGRALPLYFLGLTVWWALAAGSLVLQLRVGDRLSRLLVDPAVLPLDAAPRIVRWLQASAIAGVAGGLLAVYATVRLAKGAPLPSAGTAGGASSLIVLATMVGQFIVALHARAHAVLVANCFYESDYYRANPNLRGRIEPDDRDERDGPEHPDAVPASKRHAFTPKGDDTPIRLPGE